MSDFESRMRKANAYLTDAHKNRQRQDIRNLEDWGWFDRLVDAARIVGAVRYPTNQFEFFNECVFGSVAEVLFDDENHNPLNGWYTVIVEGPNWRMAVSLNPRTKEISCINAQRSGDGNGPLPQRVRDLFVEKF